MAGVKGRSGGPRPNSGGPRPNSGGARPGSGRKPKTTEAKLLDELKRIDEEIAKRAAERAAPIKQEAEKDVAKTPDLSLDEKRELLNQMFPIKSDDPLQFLLNVMNEPLMSMDLRIKAATKAVDFKHVKPGEIGKKQSLQESAQGVAQSDDFGTAAPPAHHRLN
jgi:phage terminase small subunit